MTSPADIVLVNVTITDRPPPNNLQKKGAIISQLGTTLTAGVPTLINQPSQLTAHLPLVATADSLALVQSVNDYFAMGADTALYILETGISGTGVGALADNIAYVSGWIAAHPQTLYAYAVPVGWHLETTFLTLVNAYNNFSTTPTIFLATVGHADFATIASNPAHNLALTTNPTETRNTAAMSQLYAITRRSPADNPRSVAPFTMQGMKGAPQFPRLDNDALFQTFENANIGYPISGREAGDPETFLKGGRTTDGKPLDWRYSVDWARINAQQAIAALVINGSKIGTLAPLWYNQEGIDRLQAVVLGVGNIGVSARLFAGATELHERATYDFLADVANGVYAGNVAINAEPLQLYKANNPTHYQQQLYAGLSMSLTPLHGFYTIVFNLNVVNFI